MSSHKSSESNQRVSAKPIVSIDERLPENLNYLPQLILPLRQPASCVVCGAPFEIVRQRGRPEKFCSDACRATQHHTQKITWASQKRKSER